MKNRHPNHLLLAVFLVMTVPIAWAQDISCVDRKLDGDTTITLCKSTIAGKATYSRTELSPYGVSDRRITRDEYESTLRTWRLEQQIEIDRLGDRARQELKKELADLISNGGIKEEITNEQGCAAIGYKWHPFSKICASPDLPTESWRPVEKYEYEAMQESAAKIKNKKDCIAAGFYWAEFGECWK